MGARLCPAAYFNGRLPTADVERTIPKQTVYSSHTKIAYGPRLHAKHGEGTKDKTVAADHIFDIFLAQAALQAKGGSGSAMDPLSQAKRGECSPGKAANLPSTSCQGFTASARRGCEHTPHRGRHRPGQQTLPASFFAGIDVNPNPLTTGSLTTHARALASKLSQLRTGPAGSPGSEGALSPLSLSDEEVNGVQRLAPDPDSPTSRLLEQAARRSLAASESKNGAAEKASETGGEGS